MRRVRLILDGLQVKSIRWRMPTSRHEGLRECMQKYDPCVYCGKPAAKHFTWEHIQPRAQGGAWGWENMARACRKCNKNRDQLPFLLFMVLKRENRITDRAFRRWAVSHRCNVSQDHQVQARVVADGGRV